MRKGDWKRKKDHRSARQKAIMYWHKEYNRYKTSKYYSAGFNLAWDSSFGGEFQPKLKKGRFHIKDYSCNSTLPKWFRNITYHRPMRRANKHYCYKMKVLQPVIYYLPNLKIYIMAGLHPYLGLSEPQYRQFEEYYD